MKIKHHCDLFLHKKDLRKLLLIMKIFSILIFGACMQLSATGFGQSINLNLKDAPLKKVFREIEKQSEYSFVYSNQQLEKEKKINLSVTNGTLDAVLAMIFKDQDITYTISEKYIVVRKISLPAIQDVSTVSVSLQVIITGKVTDDEGSPLSGVSVLVKGTKIGATTNSNGEFSLTIADKQNISLEFSSVGYKSQVLVYKGSPLNIKLSIADKNMDQVVVVGYGTVKKADLTGSVSSVSAAKITQVKGVSTVAQALQGQAAGVQVIQRSGQPGEGVSIKVRGTNSIAGGNDVLYVVDGLPLDGLSAQLNPSDIESIDVLKDASSTAIYGSRGANGVVMITTKKGIEGKTRVTYNGYYGTQSLRKKIKLINASEYTNLQNEANTNWNSDNPGSAPKSLWSATQIDSLTAHATDWQDLVYRKAAVQNQDFSISGGNAGTKYYTSFGYFNQNGIIRNSGFKRFSFRGNLDQRINAKLRLITSLSVQQSNYSQNNYFNADGGGGVPFTTMVMPPTQGVYDANGKYTVFTGVPWGQTNPYTLSKQEYRYNPSLRMIGNVALSYEIANGLKLKVSAGMDNTWSRTDYYAPSTLSLYTNGGAFQNYGNAATFVNENLLNYTKTFGDHNIDAVGGITYQESKAQSLSSGTATGFLTDIYQDNNIGAATVKAQPGSGYNDNTLISYLGRVNYTYAHKYLLTVTGRYDGSSRFSQNNKYAFFPSTALGWRVSEESFMKNIKSVSNLKLRASYGLSGNQAISSYQTLGQLNNTNVILNNQPVTGYYVSALQNSNLKWETTQQLDLGLDLGFLEDRIQFTADYYNKKTKDLLLNVTLPTSSGFSSVLQNVGAVGNKGYELQVTTKNTTGNFKWTSTLNFSHNITKILDLGKDAQGNAITYKEVGAGGNWFPMILGNSMQQLFGYKVLGVYNTDAEAIANNEPTKKAGDYKFQTTPGGILPNDNRQILSHFAPIFTYGFNNNFSYGGFNLSVFIVGSYGNDIANEFRKYNLTLNGKWTPTQDAYDNRWIAGKGNSKYDRPQTDNSGSSIRDYANSLWLEKGSYLRVRDITLSYDLPPAVLKAIKISSVQVYASVQNYITITKYSGYDPEASWAASNINGWDRGVYPSSKSIICGLKVNF